MLIRYRGRVTGRDITLPVNYASLGQDLVVLVGDHQRKRWWRNFLVPRGITVVHRGTPVHGTARVIDGAGLEGAICAEAYAARFKGTIDRAVRPLLFIRISPIAPPSGGTVRSQLIA